MQVDINQAQSTLGELVARACRGEAIVITRDGLPLVSLAPLKKPRTLGLGRTPLDDDFADRSIAPLSDEDLKLWT